MKKSIFTMLVPGSPEYVVAHAKWKKSRGRMPSMAYRGIRNPEKALALAVAMSKDRRFRDLVIKKIDEHSFTTDDGWSFGIQKQWPVAIKVGDIARFYGKGVGYAVRGLDINGVSCFYRTEEQQTKENAKWVRDYDYKQKAAFEKNRASLDEKYQNLPEVFQKRIDKFRTNNPDFRWRFEAYEMFCCEQAVIIASAIGQQLIGEAMAGGLPIEEAKKAIAERAPQVLKEFSDMPWEKQLETVPGLEDGHSGNTLGCAVALASFYVSEHPENIVKLHGALAPLVGSEEYGCVARV
jgi:hypothetical protein